MKTAIAFLSMAASLGVWAADAGAQQIKLTPQIGLGTLEQAAPDPAFEARMLSQIDGMKGTLSGSELFLLRKDRGPHAGRYAVLIASAAGTGWNSMPVTRAFPGVVQYQLIGAGTLGSLPTVDILGVHYIKVRPEKSAEFPKFVADRLNPAVGNLRPDLRFLYYQGPQPGQFISIIAITRTSRDKYWPNGSDSDDLKTAFTSSVKALATELQPFLVDGTWGVNMTAQVYEAKDWADWMVVTPAGR